MDGEVMKKKQRGPWTVEEDLKLGAAIEIDGAKQWTTIAAKAGLARCSKSCRLRWMNYLSPNIKRGDMSDQEQDLIIRMHKLLGNRWSLIAARLPGRTDNEIKNYWNHHLSKKKQVLVAGMASQHKISCTALDSDDFFDFSNENPSTLEWVTQFLQFSKR